VSRAAWASAWSFSVAVLAGLALWAATGDRVFLGRYTGYLMPWLALGLAPVLLAAVLRRRRALALLGAASLLAIAAIHAPRFAPRRAQAAADGDPFVVVSWNTWSRNGDAGRIAALVRSLRPDLLLLQEIRPRVFDAVLSDLGDLYGGAPVHHAYDAELEQAIVSRHPVEPRTSLEHRGRAQVAALRAPWGTVAVYNVHPLRIGGWRLRYDQVAALLETEILPERGPVIVAGDFNAPERSQLVALVSRHLVNAHAAAGRGLGFTFPSEAVKVLGVLPAFPIVRIDHVFVSRDLRVARAGTHPDGGGSDHRPVFAELVAPR
jgi:vancomycin resistance protein VanJ